MSLTLPASTKHEDSTEQANKDKVKEWNDFLLNIGLSKSTSDARLKKQKQEVIEGWEKLAASHHFKITADNRSQGIPTIETLYEAARLAESSWQEKNLTGFHKLRDRFCSFAGAMGDYSYLFQVIPSGDKYFSLITGTVSAMVKVSANYHKAAEALSEGLAGLDTSLSYIGRELTITSTDKMQDHVTELYNQVFMFLCQVLQWFSSRTFRVTTAFKDKYVTATINQLTTRVDQIMRDIRHEAEQSSRSKINSLVTVAANIDNKVDRISHLEDKVDKLKLVDDEILLQLRLIAHQREQNPVEVKELLNVVLEEFMNSNPRAIEQHTSSKQSSQNSVDLHLIGQKEDSQQSIGSASATVESLEPEDLHETGAYSRYDIERFTRPLRQYIKDGRNSLLNMQRTSIQSGLSAETLYTMKNWIEATETTFLYIEGHAPLGTSPVLSMAAMQLCGIALDARLPCLSFFCEPRPRYKQPSSLTDKQAGLIALIYSMILQLIQLLPVDFKSAADFTGDRLKQFSGAFSKVGEALNLIDDIMEEVDGMLHFIVDGINLIEDQDTRPYILDLIEMLRRKGQRMICKVCFTTNGNSMVLNRALKVTERKKEQASFGHVAGRINHGIGTGGFRHIVPRPL